MIRCWWHDQALLDSYLLDFLADSLQRRGLASGNPGSASLLLEQLEEYGFSSLDFLDMASRFSLCLGLDRSGLSDLLLARRSLAQWHLLARQSLDLESGMQGFYSSGSTAAPSLNRHESWRLQREVDLFLGLLPGFRRVVSLVPAHHIYGFLWGILLPHTAQVSRLGLDPQHSLPCSWPGHWQEDDLIVATPALWELILHLDLHLPASFVGISSTSPLPQPLYARLCKRHPKAQFWEIYGASETSGIAWRAEPAGAFELLDCWQLLRNNGEYHLRDRDQGKTYSVLDHLSMIDERRFTLGARKDGIVQLAGRNVSLDGVRSIWRSHPDVADVQVRVVGKGSSAGLKVFLALKALPADWRGWSEALIHWYRQQRGNLPPCRSIVAGQTLPRNALGKLTDWDESQYPLVTGNVRRAGLAQGGANNSSIPGQRA